VRVAVKRLVVVMMTRHFPKKQKNKKLHSNWCLVCEKEFDSVRSDVMTCSPKCRKALSRSPAGHMARLRRLGRTAALSHWTKVS
jgi:hypothetical protein